jgi:hypothetical protein
MDLRPTSNTAATAKIGNPEGCFPTAIWLPEISAPSPYFDLGS